MTHVEFEYHFAKEAERFGISKFIRENNRDYDFQSFMLSLSGIVARNELIDEEKLEMLADEAYRIGTLIVPYDDCVSECKECFKLGYRVAKNE